MKQKKNQPRIDTSSETASLVSTMGDLMRRAGFSAASEVSPTPPVETDIAPKVLSGPLPSMRSIRIRLERKHRKGKTVTIVDGVSSTPEELDSLLKQLKSALGCGGTVEDNALVLQGDMTDRVRAWFAKHTT